MEKEKENTKDSNIVSNEYKGSKSNKIFNKCRIVIKSQQMNNKSKYPFANTLIKQNSWENETSNKSYCRYICDAIPLICKNFKLKMCDNLLLGGEHAQKISPGYHSPIRPNYEDEIMSDEKKEIVMASPSFGMFSLFRYHLYRGYMNKELKKINKIYCSHIFSLLVALPILVFLGQWLLYSSLVIHEIKSFNGTICGNNDTFENKLMISGISIIYFTRSFFIWDNITNTLSLKKMNRVNSVAAILDTFQEFSFNILVFGANIWVVFVEKDIQNMILNSLAMEFLMTLDNEFKELYFKYLPGTADDIYDNIFVSYYDNKDLLEDRLKNDSCFRCFNYVIYIPYKLLVIIIFLFPLFCFFMIFAGAICK